VKIGDLVSYTINRPGFPTKEGIIIKHRLLKARELSVFTVLFLDGTQNSHIEQYLEVLSESR
jgi:hypothetical protein